MAEYDAPTYDALVIGGGHNGLTAAAYMAKAGLSVLVLERRDILGGAAITQEIHPGFRISLASYSLGMMRSEIVRELELERHGLSAIPYAGSLDLLNDGRAVLFTKDDERNRAMVAQMSPSDWQAILDLRAKIMRVGEVLRSQWLRQPMDFTLGLSSLLSAAAAGKALYALSPEDRHFLSRLFVSSAYDLVHKWFESDTIRHIYAGHCLAGNAASIRAPGSALPFFMGALGELNGVRGSWGMAKGGMGTVTRALAAAAREHGALLRTDAPVAQVAVEGGRAVGVTLNSGETIRARAVLSNADPKRTFLKLVPPGSLDAGFVREIQNYRMGSATFRINLALSAAPRFAGVADEEHDTALRSIMHVLPDIATNEANHRSAIEGEWSRDPYMVIQVASAIDPDLAPPGKHVMGLLCKYFPYRLSGGRNWDDEKEGAADHMLRVVAKHVPNLPDIVLARHVMSPLDLERIFGLTEGDVFHGRQDLDQVFSLRPHPGASGYETPLPGLYLCGAGSHPGGSVTGAPGHNAAKHVIRVLGRRRAKKRH